MATYYWVGGTGTWDAVNTANWSATSGGAGGAGAPTPVDAVIFDANSGTGLCTTALGSACSNANLNSLTLGLTLGANHTMSIFTLTQGVLSLQTFTLQCFAFNANFANNRTIAFGTGNITVTGNNGQVFSTNNSTGLTITGTPVVNFTYAGSVGTRDIYSAPNEQNAITINVSAGSDAVRSIGSLYAFNNINFTGFSGSFSLVSNIQVYGDLTISSGMTIVPSASGIIFNSTSKTQNITTSGKTIDVFLRFNGVNSTYVFQDALTQGSTRAFTINNGTVQLKNGVTSTVGSFVANNSNVKFLQSTTPGSQATLSQASGTVNASYLTIKDINATGGAMWNAFTTSGNVDAGNNLGWDFSTQIGRYIYTRRKNKRILS